MTFIYRFIRDKYEDNVDFQTVDSDCSDATSGPCSRRGGLLEYFDGVGFLTSTPGAATL